MELDESTLAILYDIHGGLPRQGPGCRASTLQALAACQNLPDCPDVLDIGCGPGMQTQALAEALSGRIIAVDIHVDFLRQLQKQPVNDVRAARPAVVAADMHRLPFLASSFDLIWSEGAAYNMGIANALQAWRPMLRPGGYLAFTELVWLDPDPPAEVAAFFGREYPPMTDVAEILRVVSAAGYACPAHFTLPDAAWWRDYYTPLEQKLPEMRRKYAADDAASTMIAATAEEIDLRRRCPAAYGYVFFVTRPTG